MVRKIQLLFTFLFLTNMASEAQQLALSLYNSHEKYIEKKITERRFKHAQVANFVEKHKNNKLFDIGVAGLSVEQRFIYQIKLGSGPTKVLLWSQMHGDEATATMAIADILNFFDSKNDGFDDFRKQILTNCTLYFVPMLNPDGAEKFIRRNALGIDLNRDALRTQSPEAVLLKKLQNELKPDFGFNLHDQSPRYSAGKTGNLATISFLATAYNEAREINPIRKRSMQLIVEMNEVLQQFIPNQVGRFSDEFEPRAFGDNIQKWGTTLILIESGGYKNDPEKQYIRKLNFVSILAGLASISNKSFEKIDIKQYEKIPQNEKYIFDLLIRNATLVSCIGNKKIDLGINRIEKNKKNGNGFEYKSTMEDMGDLSTFFGVDEIDATGLTIEAISPLVLDEKTDFNLKKGDKIIYKIQNGSLVK